MENPEAEIRPIIHSLTQGKPSIQKANLEKYFVENASFTHPFCRTGSFRYNFSGTIWDSRWLMLQIYQWYKILSPHIYLRVNSVAFDKGNMLLYVGMQQQFKLWFVPFYVADVRLTTVLKLVQRNADPTMNEFRSRYYIQHQEDLYQTSEWIKFIVPWGIGVTVMLVWQFWATAMCVLGATLLYPLTLMKESQGENMNVGGAVHAAIKTTGEKLGIDSK